MATTPNQDIDTWLDAAVRGAPTSAREAERECQGSSSVKLKLEINAPLHELVQHLETADQAQRPGTGANFTATHLQLNVNVSEVVRIEEREEGTVCIIPDEEFGVTINHTSPYAISRLVFNPEQHQAVVNSYRRYFFAVLQIIAARFPQLLSLDIDACGSLSYYALLFALSLNNHTVARRAAELFDQGPLEAMTVQTGGGLDVWKKVEKGQATEAPWAEWDLVTTCGVKDMPRGGIEPVDLWKLREELRGDIREEHLKDNIPSRPGEWPPAKKMLRRPADKKAGMRKGSARSAKRRDSAADV